MAFFIDYKIETFQFVLNLVFLNRKSSPWVQDQQTFYCGFYQCTTWLN